MKPTLTLLTALLLAPLVALHAADATALPAPAANCEFPADWFLYGMADRNTPEPDFTTITDIPATLAAGRLSLSAKATRLERCRRFLYLDLQTATAVPGPAGRPIPMGFRRTTGESTWFTIRAAAPDRS